MSGLESLLRDWLPPQRWYGGKGRALTGVRLLSQTPLPGTVDVRVTLLEVDTEGAEPERYQLLVGRRTGVLEQRLEHAVDRRRRRARWPTTPCTTTTRSAALLSLLASGAVGRAVALHERRRGRPRPGPAG